VAPFPVFRCLGLKESGVVVVDDDVAIVERLIQILPFPLGFQEDVEVPLVSGIHTVIVADDDFVDSAGVEPVTVVLDAGFLVS
jgi:hypothetical protein